MRRMWHGPAYARRNARRTPTDFVVEMWFAPALAVAVTLTLALDRQAALPACAPVLLLWLASPIVAWWISRPIVVCTQHLTADQRVFLRGAARRTWRFFTDFVGPDDNWLPPDNFQEYPVERIASRTSPTNMSFG